MCSVSVIFFSVKYNTVEAFRKLFLVRARLFVSRFKTRSSKRATWRSHSGGDRRIFGGDRRTRTEGLSSPTN